MNKDATDLILNNRRQIADNLWLVFPKNPPPDVELDWDFYGKVVYGPAISRRFGLSLGINLFPEFKQCNFNCVYCLADRTANSQRKVVSSAELIKTMEEDFAYYLIKQNLIAHIDSIGFCGNGEPTIHPEFTQMAEFVLDYRDFLARKFGKTVLVGTFSNSSRISKLDSTLSKMDILVFKLDAGEPKTFSEIARTKMRFSKVVESLKAFPSPYIVSSACVVGEAISNVSSLVNGFCNVVNTLPRAISVQIHNINLPTPVSGIRHLPMDFLVQVGKEIAYRVAIPVEILADNEYIL